MIKREFGVSSSQTELVNVCGYFLMLTKSSFRSVRSIRRSREKIGRNSPCPCDSGKKHKNCCISKKRFRNF